MFKISNSHIHQSSSYDCGIACIAMIFRYHGYDINYYHLCNKLNITSQGINLKDMYLFFQNINTNPKVYYLKNKIDTYYSDLQITQFPIIALLNEQKNNHYIVIYSIKKGKIKYSDPNENHIKTCSSIDILNKIIVVITTDFSNPLLEEIVIKTKYNLIADLLNKQKFEFIKVMVLSLFLTIINFVISMRLGIIIDYIFPLGKNAYIFLMILCCFFVFLLVIQMLFSYVKDFVCYDSFKEIEKQLNKIIVSKILNDNIKSIEQYKTGELLSRISDCTSMTITLSNLITTMVPNCLICLLALIYLIKSSFILTTIVCLVAVIIYITYRITYREVYSKNYDSTEVYSRYNGLLVERLDCFEDIKTTFSNEYHINSINKVLKEYIDVSLDKEKYVLSIKIIRSLLLSLSALWVLYVVSQMYLNNKILIGELIIYINLFNVVINFVLSLTNYQIQLENFFISLNRIEQIIDLSSERLKENKSKYYTVKINSENVVNNIELLNFRLLTNNNYIFSNVNIVFNHKYNIICGESGSGKSSLLKCIANLKSDYQGDILVNGNTNLCDAKARIVYVASDINLFNGSIYDNLCLGKNILSSRLRDICFDFCILDLIESFSDGFEHIISAQTNNLSTGEKQRLALVRAILLDPDVLILDEALSNIDEDNKEKILKNLNKYRCMYFIVGHEDLYLQDYQKFLIKDCNLFLDKIDS